MELQKKVEKMDPLSIAESLGIRTFRKLSRNAWSAEDDSQLTSCLMKMCKTPLNQIDADSVDWDLVSSKLSKDGTRKAKDYKKRWTGSLDPNVKKGKWSQEEDARLIEAYEKFGPSWQRVASYIQNRTMDQCAKRYTEVLDPKTKDRLNPWTKEEELLLIKQIGIHGTKWRTVASHFKNRPALTCRNKWRTIALSVARGRANPYITAEVEKITNKNGTLNTKDVHETSPASVSTNSPTHAESEWKYTLTPSANTPKVQLPHSHFLSDNSGTIKDEELVNQLIAYAKTYKLNIEIHQHIHHHYGPPPHPFNHIQPPSSDYVWNNSNYQTSVASPQSANRSYFLEPEAQMNRFQHFNYLPPLTEVPKLTSSNSPIMSASSGKDKNKKGGYREDSPGALTPLTQAVELAAEELTKKRSMKEDSHGNKKAKTDQSDDEEADGLDFWEQMRNIGELSGAQTVSTLPSLIPDSSSGQYNQKPVSQHHPLHYFTGSVTPQPLASTPAQIDTQQKSQMANKVDEDEDEDAEHEDIRSYGLFYKSYQKSRSVTHFDGTNNEAPTNENSKKKDDNKSVTSTSTGDDLERSYAYENLLGSFGMMPFNPS